MDAIASGFCVIAYILVVSLCLGFWCAPIYEYWAVPVNICEFVAEDHHAGVPILCRFRWTVHGPERASWDQAFSTDDGTTWETNWVMEETRVE